MNVIINLLRKTIKTKIFSNFLNLSIIQISNILLMILIYPILTRVIGLENFGKVMVANSFAGLMGILVNYGTIQTSIKEVAIFKDDNKLLSGVFFNTFTIRFMIFILIVVFLSISFLVIKENFLFYLLALPIVLAEVLNPMFFFLGVEKLKILNLSNLISKIITLTLILLLIRSGEDFIWVNFLMGSVLSLAYIFNIIWAIKKYRLKFSLPTKMSQFLILKGNFYLLVNNFVVHLQQSLMLFTLQYWGNALWLGAYALCDKVIWSSRLLIISISNSIYPKAAQMFTENRKLWNNFKFKVRMITSIIFLFGSCILFFIPDIIVEVLAGEQNEIAIKFLKQMAFVPLLACLNFTNVIERLLHQDYFSIFKFALVILFFSAIGSYLFVSFKSLELIGHYAVIIEFISLLLYEFLIKNEV